jgi:hypothetical protein
MPGRVAGCPNHSPPPAGSLPRAWKRADEVSASPTLPGVPAPEAPTRRVDGSSATADEPTLERHEPLVLGRYRLVRRLGAGGFGAVWLARDERLGRDVAVKAVPRAERRPDGRPEREAIAAARLNHPGIVALYEAGADDDGHYLVSELVSGPTLADLVGGGSLSDRDVARVGVALADALAHAHERGVIHRDVKPHNVIVPDRPQSAAGIAKLTDFGIAHLVGDEPLTRTGDVVGTLAYMAPEQAEGRRVTEAADVYALALVLYEALAGAHPVRGAGPAETARRLGAVLPSLGRARRDLPGDVVAAIDRALRPRPEERGPLGDLRAALAAAIEELSDEGGRLSAPALDRRLPRGLGRVAAGAGAGALAVAALLAAWPGTEAADRALPFAAERIGASHALATGLAVAVAVAGLPRAAWLAAALAAVAWLALAPMEAGGVALVVAAALAVCPLLAPRAGRAWSAPALAPLLGLAYGAVAFCALAGQARTFARRAGLAAAGFWWLSLAEPLVGRDLYLGRADGTLPAADWAGSASAAASDALAPLLTSGALAAAAVWALAAGVLPWVVRGRTLVVDVAGAAAWAVALAAGTGAVAEALSAGAQPRGGAVAALATGALAVALRAARGPNPARLRAPRRAPAIG